MRLIDMLHRKIRLHLRFKIVHVTSAMKSNTLQKPNKPNILQKLAYFVNVSNIFDMNFSGFYLPSQKKSRSFMMFLWIDGV